MDVSVNAIRREKERKGIRKKEVKSSFLVDCMITYAENAKDSKKNLLELISNYGNNAEYRVNI